MINMEGKELLVQEGKLFLLSVGQGHAGGYQGVLFVRNPDLIGGGFACAMNFP